MITIGVVVTIVFESPGPRIAENKEVRRGLFLKFLYPMITARGYPTLLQYLKNTYFSK
jgi:hypothetical protein